MDNRISAIAIQNLYKDTLVLIDEKIQNDKINAGQMVSNNDTFSSELQEIVYTGNNERRIVFVLKDENSGEWQETLQKLITACKLKMKDIAIINAGKNIVTAEKLKNQLKAQTTLLFGLTSGEIGLPFSIPDYQIQPYDNCRYMQAPVATLSTDNSPEIRKEKQLLWGKLKELFL